MRAVVAAIALGLWPGGVALAEEGPSETAAAEEPGASAEAEKLLEELQAASEPLPAAKSGAAANAYNPAVSANGLLLGSASSSRQPAADRVQTALAIQEIELQLTASVD